jgi:hypothetical protein
MPIPVELFRYTCSTCGHVFDSIGVPDMVYGVFAMHTESGRAAVFDAFSSAARVAYDEIADLIKAHPRVKQLDKSQRSDVLQEVFGELCDPAADGTAYSMTQHPPCPKCRSRQMKSWGPYNHPPRSVFDKMPEITTSHWDGLNGQEKQQAMETVLNRIRL